MRFSSIIFLCFITLAFQGLKFENAEKLNREELLIAFYNVDNLYDTLNDPKTNDDEFTPQGKKQWNTFKYQRKLKNLAQVIRQFDGQNTPDVLGLCEIENLAVLKDLAQSVQSQLYQIAHIDSKDERGVDVALFYNKNKFKLLNLKAYTPSLHLDTSDRTRDVLWVKLLEIQSHDTFQFLLAHFPSRREGQLKSEPNRLDVAALCKKIIQEQCNANLQNLILMGDFNDEPFNKSMSQVIGGNDFNVHPEAQFFNLMYPFISQKSGSYRYKNEWNMLDQFVISRHLYCNKNPHYLQGSVFIKQDPFLFSKGKYAGAPHRTYAGDKWINGYSDHLPIGFKISIR